MFCWFGGHDRKIQVRVFISLDPICTGLMDIGFKNHHVFPNNILKNNRLKSKTSEGVSSKMSEKAEMVEDLVISLLGADEMPLKGKDHLQIEIFMLTRSKPELKELFSFQKSDYGPCSRLLGEVVENPVCKENPYSFDGSKMSLSSSGKKELEKVRKKMGHEEFIKLRSALCLIRTLYDDLDSEELMLLIRDSYPRYFEKSSVSEDLDKKKEIIVKRLLSKKAITSFRAKDLLGGF